MNEEQSTRVANFAELLAQLMKEENITKEELAKQIHKIDADGNYTGTTITNKTVDRWQEGNNTPSKREYVLQMIKAFRLSQKGKVGLEKCNALLRAANKQELKEDEQNKYFPDLQDEPPLKSEPPPKTEKSLISCFAYDNFWVGREKLVAELSTKIVENYRVLMLLGLTGIGKTALAEKLTLDLKNWLEGDWKNRLRRANFDYFDKSTDFVTVATRWLEEWGEKLTPEESKPERLLSHLVKRLSDNRTLVLIDSLERLLTGNEEEGWGDFADEWWEKFFFNILSAESCESRIIITSQDLPTQLDQTRYQNFLFRHVLFGLDENEQEALFEIAGFDVSEHSFEKPILLRLGKAYKGHPLVLRVILGEITESFQRNVQAYWEDISGKVEEVEKAIAEAEADANKIVGSQDEWKLHKLTRQVTGQVNKERLNSVFARLSTQVRDAYILICASSVYRIPVQQEGWTMQLSALVKRLDKRECSQQRQEKALEELDKRFLVEKSYNHNNKRMLGQHNLIRSVALEHQKMLLQDLKAKVK